MPIISVAWLASEWLHGEGDRWFREFDADRSRNVVVAGFLVPIRIGVRAIGRVVDDGSREWVGRDGKGRTAKRAGKRFGWKHRSVVLDSALLVGLQIDF